jgi:8-oxo-dGTP pyrophosphatase MutT (NUDIX family)
MIKSDPHWVFFTAAKVFLVNKGRILFIRESREYRDGSNRGVYDIPGGRLKTNESILAGLSREVREETGLSMAKDTIWPLAEKMWEVPKGAEIWRIHAHFFVAEVATDYVTLSKDHDDYVWMRPEKALHDLTLMKNHNELIDKMMGAFGHLFTANTQQVSS